MIYKRLTDSETAVMLKNTEGSSWDSEDMEAQRYIRLAELEDKIENGTLVELPCKMGDKVYRICGTPKRRFIKEKICWGICFNNFGIEIHTDGAEDIISDNIFLTKADAEKKLEELSKNP